MSRAAAVERITPQEGEECVSFSWRRECPSRFSSAIRTRPSPRRLRLLALGVILLELLQVPTRRQTLRLGQAGDEEDALEVIELVLNDASLEVLEDLLLPVAVEILRLDDDARRSLDPAAHVGDREAAFLVRHA